jgi:hypothetical protein
MSEELKTILDKVLEEDYERSENAVGENLQDYNLYFIGYR